MHLLTSFIFRYGILAVFFLILLEYACFPISSEFVLPFSGAVASIQHVSFFFLLPISVLAGLIGISICYGIGKYGGVPLLNKIEHRFPKSQKPIQASYRIFHKYGLLAVCIGRVIPLCRTYISFVAGALGLPFGRYLGASAIGITIWNTLLIGLGYLFHDNWSLIGHYYQEYKHLILLLIPIVLLVFWLRKKD